jgi:hypothetical protein
MELGRKYARPATSPAVHEREADRIAERVLRTEAPWRHPLVLGPARSRPTDELNMTPIVRNALRSSDARLDPAVRHSMESRFGHNFANIRVHTDDAAANAAQSLRAEAMTVGDHIFFAAGRYAPATANGQRLLAHELVHTLQTNAPGVMRKQSTNFVGALFDAVTWEVTLARLMVPGVSSQDTELKFADGSAFVRAKGSVGVKVVDAAGETVMTLAGTQDLNTLVQTATAHAASTLGPKYFEWRRRLQRAPSALDFLAMTREMFYAAVTADARAAGPLKTAPELDQKKPNEAGSGRFNYLPIQQRLHDSAAASTIGIECYGSTLVHALENLGLTNPTLSRREFEERHTTLHGKPTSPDSVAFSESSNLALRGKIHKGSVATLDNVMLLAEVKKFRKTDWAKLTGMDKMDFELVDLRRETASKLGPAVISGFPVQVAGATGTFYSNSGHFVNARDFKSKSATETELTYVDPLESTIETLSYSKNESKKVVYKWVIRVKVKPLEK